MSDTPNPDTVGSVRAVSEPPATLSVPRARLDSLAGGLERAQVACAARDSYQVEHEIHALREALAALRRDHAEIRDEWDERSSQFVAPQPQRVIVEVSRQRSDPPSSVAPAVSRRAALRALLGTRRGKVVAGIAGALTTLGVAMPERFASAVVAFVEAFLQ